MNELVFLLEERSMQEVLQVIVPPLVPGHVTCRFIPHEGKKDLEKSIPRKLRAWKTPGVQFVVVRDKNAGDCKAVKRKHVSLCKQGNRPDAMVRIVCHCLEAWFLGDLAAVESAYGLTRIAKRQQQRKYSDPDLLSNAEEELRRLVPPYQKVGGARLISPHLSIDANQSHSFRVFIAGVRRLVEGKARKP
jgi:hypothetical protein